MCLFVAWLISYSLTNALGDALAHASNKLVYFPYKLGTTNWRWWKGLHQWAKSRTECCEQCRGCSIWEA